MNSGGTQKKTYEWAVLSVFFHMGSGHEIPGSPSLFNGRSCCNLLTFDDFFPKFDHRPWMKSLCRRWIDGRFLVDKNVKKKTKQIRYSGKKRKYPKIPEKGTKNHLLHIPWCPSSWVHQWYHMENNSPAPHCLGPIQGLISMADAGSRDKSGWWLSPYLFHSQLFLEKVIKFHGSSHHQPVNKFESKEQIWESTLPAMLHNVRIF